MSNMSNDIRMFITVYYNTVSKFAGAPREQEVYVSVDTNPFTFGDDVTMCVKDAERRSNGVWSVDLVMHTGETRCSYVIHNDFFTLETGGERYFFNDDATLASRIKNFLKAVRADLSAKF